MIIGEIEGRINILLSSSQDRDVRGGDKDYVIFQTNYVIIVIIRTYYIIIFIISYIKINCVLQ
jgi:hypothetical protein